jgi:hypothetical protein
MPLVSLPVAVGKEQAPAEFRLSFDCLLDRDSPGEINVTLRGVGLTGEAETAGLLVIRQGALLANGRPVVPLQPGVWYHIEATCLLSSKVSRSPHVGRMLSLSVRTASGEAWSLTVPYEDFLFERPTEVQMISLGAAASRVFIDNLIATVSR